MGILQILFGISITTVGGWIFITLLNVILYGLPGDLYWSSALLVAWPLVVYYFVRLRYPMIARGALIGLGTVFLYLAIIIFFVVTGTR